MQPADSDTHFELPPTQQPVAFLGVPEGYKRANRVITKSRVGKKGRGDSVQG